MSPATATSNVEFDHLPEAWNPEKYVPRRPIGLAALCVAIALVSVIVILGSILFLVGTYAAGWLPANAVPSSTDIVGSLTPLTAGLLFVFAGIMLGVATALWRQEVWALYTVYTVLVVAMVYLLVTGTFVVALAVLAGIFLYLVAVRNYFY